AAGEGGQLGAIAVGDVDGLVLSARQVEEQLHLQGVGAVEEPVELHELTSTAAGDFPQTISSHDVHEFFSCTIRGWTCRRSMPCAASRPPPASSASPGPPRSCT